MRLHFLLKFAVILFLTFYALPGTYEQIFAQSDKSTSKYKFGLATGLAGLGDKSFNDMQYNGMILAKKKYGISFIYDSPATVDDDIPVIEGLIEKGCNVIIAGGGYHMKDPVDILSQKHPGVKFIILDDFANKYHKNVYSVALSQNEGSFLAGALAAQMTKTGNIAVIGAMNIDIINDFVIGYKAGAKYIDKSVNVIVKYISEKDGNINPFTAPKVAKNMSIELYDQDHVDIIYSVATASNMGVFAAAREKGKYAIGVDSDQDFHAKGLILTSMMKRLDAALVYIIGLLMDNKIENKPYVIGLENKGVSLTPMTYTRHIIPDACIKKLDRIRDDIINHKITAPTVFN
ncbi:MAG: BMP family ABC transporter substrate-binding protein [bacterium]|nr:BMP family ABC transporter substrate-binding protein [bacterium]